MSTQSLGLAEHDVKHLNLTEQNLNAKYVSKIVSEPPSFKLIQYFNDRWYVPLPWTHYLLLKSAEAKKRTWMLYSIYMSPRHLTGIRFRKVSQPIVPNIYDYRPIYRPCQRDGTKYQDINKLIASFWDGRFNRDILPLAHPVIDHINKSIHKHRGRGDTFDELYFQRWESLTIEELLKMPWPQNVRI